MIQKVKDLYKKQFNNDPELIYFSPGRVNIIGEHIDYNGGNVLPMAISLGIYAAVTFRNDEKCFIYSDTFEESLLFDVNNFIKDDSYSKYIKGVIYILRKHNYINKINGFNIVLLSTLPASSGLSSSAALELLIINILNDYYKLNIKNIDLVKLSQETERNYVGVNCGIMDQFAIGMSIKDKAIYLNTSLNIDNEYDYKYIDFEISNATLVIINTNKPRNLVESKYNERRSECEKGLNIFKSVINKNNLCDYSLDELNNNKNLFDDILYKRLHHVISENERVKKALEAMQSGNSLMLGKLLTQSHESLKEDYEVTGIHLDTIFEELNKYIEVLGVRMTGAGFGGCLIALFEGNNHLLIDGILREVKEKYYDKTGIYLDYYYVESSDKTHCIGR